MVKENKKRSKESFERGRVETVNLYTHFCIYMEAYKESCK